MTTSSRITASAPSRGQTKDWLGTVGWAAKGVLYLLIAVLAFQLALSGGTDADQASKQGAMQSLVDKPLGSFMLVLVVIGLFAYAAYRLATVVLPGSEAGEDSKKKLARQAAHLGSAIAYAVVGAQGVAILAGKGSGGGDEAQKTWSAVLLSSTLGTLLLLAVGVGLLVFAGWQVKKAVTRSFLEKMDCPTGSWINRSSVEKVGMTGLIARAAVAALLGIFVILAVWHHDSNEVRGLDGALRSLIDMPFGPFLLGLTALGLAAYGVFALMCSRCRRHELG